MEIRLPKLGEGADSGVVVGIMVKEGDQVQEGQALLELENEKAVASVPAPAGGRIANIRVKAGEMISVGQVILTIEAGSDGAGPAKPEAVETTEPKKEREPNRSEPESKARARPKSDGEVAAAPSIRRLARELGLDLTRVQGSESGGRIGMNDLRNYLRRLQNLDAKPGTESTPMAPASDSVDFSKWGKVTKQPLSQMRKVIGQRMRESWATIPRVTQFAEADITSLMELRGKYQAAYHAKDARLTLTPFALKAIVFALKKRPIFNSSLDEAAGEIVLKEYYHIGLAVDTDGGLLVPVLRDVDKKTLLQLATEVEQLAVKARERRLSSDEMKGGTFTLSNQGGIGGAHFTPIINLPEVAILGLGRGALKPVIKDKQVQPRMILPVAVSYDHRVIDGGAAARFTLDLVQALENFSEADVQISTE